MVSSPDSRHTRTKVERTSTAGAFSAHCSRLSLLMPHPRSQRSPPSLCQPLTIRASSDGPVPSPVIDLARATMPALACRAQLGHLEPLQHDPCQHASSYSAV